MKLGRAGLKLVPCYMLRSLAKICTGIREMKTLHKGGICAISRPFPIKSLRLNRQQPGPFPCEPIDWTKPLIKLRLKPADPILSKPDETRIWNDRNAQR